MNIGELFVGLSFNADLTTLTRFGNSLTGTTKFAMGLKNAVIGLSYTLTNLVSSALQTAVQLENFRLQTDLSIQTLQRWQYVANQNNVSNQSLSQSILGIQQAQANLMMGQGNIRPWAILKIDPRQDPFVIIQQLKQKIKGLPSGIAMGLITQLGLTPDMINILKSSNLEFDKLNQKFMLTNKEQNKLLDLNKIWKDLGFSIKGTMSKLVAVNYKPLLDFFVAIKRGLVLLFEMTMKFSILIQNSHKLQTALLGIGAVLGALSLFNPFMRWTTIIGALILILEDFYIYTKGGKSVIGDFLNSFKEMDIVKTFSQSFDKISNSFEKLGNSLQKLKSIDINFKRLKETLPGLFKVFDLLDWSNISKKLQEGFIFTIDLAVESINSLINSFVFLLTLIQKIQEKGIKGLFTDTEFLKNLSDFGNVMKFAMMPLGTTLLDQKKGQDENKNIKINKELGSIVPPSISKSLYSNLTNSSQTDNKNITQNINANININESKNPHQTAQDIKKVIKETQQKELNKVISTRKK